MSVSFWIWMAVLAVFVFLLLPTFIMAGVLYTVLLVRNKPDKWGRVCSFPEDEEYVGMYGEALDWHEKWSGNMREVSVTNDGLRLAGEYFDFGAKRAVIIVAGRTEACLYGCYFAEPYRAAGYNVLIIDNRAHGLSEGRYATLGVKESRDLLAWSELLHGELGNEGVWLHGVCIGAAAALYALTAKDCPDYMLGMTADGMFTTFYESFKNHMIDMHHPNFPLTLEVMAHIRLWAGSNVVTDGPIKHVAALKKPILFLHSREDVFSLPEKAELLYGRCGSPNKKLVWFEKGAHSRLRVNDTERYDLAVREFLKSV